MFKDEVLHQENPKRFILTCGMCNVLFAGDDYVVPLKYLPVYKQFPRSNIIFEDCYNELCRIYDGPIMEFKRKLEAYKKYHE